MSNHSNYFKNQLLKTMRRGPTPDEVAKERAKYDTSNKEGRAIWLARFTEMNKRFYEHDLDRPYAHQSVKDVNVN